MPDSNVEGDYDDYEVPGNKNRAMSAKLGSKEGTNRDATRGASQDVVGGQKEIPNPAYSFFGSSDGHNKDCQNNPVVKPTTKPTLGEY